MFSLTYTGTNVLPLYTAIVCPTKSGLIIEARDQVLITAFLPDSSVDAGLVVQSISVDGGRMLKRIQPAPQGRAHRVRKRSNHVTIIVGRIAEEVSPSSDNA